jgi:hypothetical protein
MMCLFCGRDFLPVYGRRKYCSAKCGTKYRAKSHDPEWQVLCSMKHRCYNPKSSGYKNYGGRGITICDRWNSGDPQADYEAFVADMGRRPTARHSIDRIDNDGNYERTNCRWATKKRQARNKRTNVWITIEGIRALQVTWAERTGISSSLIYSRMKSGLTKKEAIMFDPRYKTWKQRSKTRDG